MTIKNCYPLTLTHKLIDRVKGSKYFTKLDIHWGYNNVRIKEGDEWKAAFKTSHGMCEPLVMFFGLTNSPATFQTMMNDIFRDLINRGHIIIYLDDILIFTETMEEQCQLVTEVLELLWQHKLYLKPEKCDWEKLEIEYLGHIISGSNVKMDPGKIKAISQWKEP
jgi:Reverse transcriptase (RNA-dependent DNA polymerase)